MLLSLIFSVITRKKSLVFWSLFAIATCNLAFFTVAIQKRSFLHKYACAIPSFSGNDIFVVAADSADILHPKMFSFPYIENVSGHADVLAVSGLVSSEDGFKETLENPEVLVISLKASASNQKWIDTFSEKGEFVAVHSSRFKHLYNKAILARNDALYTHFFLLSMISMAAFFGALVFTAALPIKLYKEMSTFLLEGVDFVKTAFCFGVSVSAITALPAALIFAVSALYLREVDLLFRLFTQALSGSVLTSFFVCVVTLFIGRRKYVKNRVL